MTSSALQTDKAPASDADCQWLAGATGGRYDVIREIARGGMSNVLLAWDHEAGRQVALKVLGSNHAASVEGRERFRREALIISRADHAHIVPCYDFVCQGNGAVAVTRYIPGDSLADRLTGVPLDPEALLAILVPIADALAHVHRRGIVHRDVKPANILLREGDDRPFLIDFGIATLSSSDYSRWEATQRLGTPEFMSPEQALGAWDADHRSDIYSLGLVAHLGLTGELPFRGNPLALAAQRAALDVPPLRRRVPPALKKFAAIVDRCLARDPRRRWRGAGELSRALAQEARRMKGHGTAFSAIRDLVFSWQTVV